MTQCKLVDDENHIDTRWIETNLAKVGKRVREKKTGKIWKVAERYDTWETERVLSYQFDYEEMATVSDSVRDSEGHWKTPRKPKG